MFPIQNTRNLYSQVKIFCQKFSMFSTNVCILNSRLGRETEKHIAYITNPTFPATNEVPLRRQVYGIQHTVIYNSTYCGIFEFARISS